MIGTVVSVRLSRATAGGGPDNVARVLTSLIRDLEQFESLLQTERDRISRERAAARSARLRSELARVSAQAHRALSEIREPTRDGRHSTGRHIAN